MRMIGRTNPKTGDECEKEETEVPVKSLTPYDITTLFNLDSVQGQTHRFDISTYRCKPKWNH